MFGHRTTIIIGEVLVRRQLQRHSPIGLARAMPSVRDMLLGLPSGGAKQNAKQRSLASCAIVPVGLGSGGLGSDAIVAVGHGSGGLGSSDASVAAGPGSGGLGSDMKALVAAALAEVGLASGDLGGSEASVAEGLGSGSLGGSEASVAEAIGSGDNDSEATVAEGLGSGDLGSVAIVATRNTSGSITIPPPRASCSPGFVFCTKCRQEVPVHRAQLSGKSAGCWKCNACN